MSQDKLQQAQKLIEKGKYDKARKILQPLAATDNEALEILERLNKIAPMGPVKSKKSGIGCGTIILACAACIVIVIILVVVNQQASQDEAEEANDGKGAIDNPIPADTIMIFDDFDVTPLRGLQPANNTVEQMNMFNEERAAGSDYVLLYLKMDCKKEEGQCRGTSVRIWLVDEEGAEWGEATFLTLDDDLDTKESIKGGSADGWVGFEYPEGQIIHRIKINESGGATLYALPPSDIKSE